MSVVISAQVSDDLAERINEFREGEPPEYDESRSAAVERLVRKGIESEESEMSQTELAFMQAGWMVGGLTILLGLSDSLDLSGLLFGIGFFSLATGLYFYRR